MSKAKLVVLVVVGIALTACASRELVTNEKQLGKWETTVERSQ